MGAAQLLQTLELQPGFCAVAAESPFSNFRRHRLRPRRTIFSWWHLDRPHLVSSSRGSRPGICEVGSMDSISRKSLQDSVSKSPVPLLLIHGAIDRNIPVRHSERIRARNPRVTLWEVPNADHCGAFSTDHDQFVNKLIAWFRAPVSLRSFANYKGPLFQDNILTPAPQGYETDNLL
jgi:pimeloyl-ACP methyl ester carboxylesterase